MRTILLGAISVFIFSGCVVSKKKYEACLADKAKVNKELSATKKEKKILEERIASNISEFEKMKNELHLSNSVKSDEMSDLLVRVTQLTDANEELETKLAETLKLYKYQKQTSNTVGVELKNLRTDNIKLKRDTASIKYALKLSKERFIQLEKELKSQKNKYNSLSSNNQKLNKDLDISKQKMATFEQQLIRNKEKLETISKSLIELRKEMLSAKTSNKAIDPNKNKHIDKMARTLGHY